MTDTLDRTLEISREIAAPLDTVWSAWTDPDKLPTWWGPEGFTCRTTRIDLRDGGEWVFDMIGPDGTVYPNHHADMRHEPPDRIRYRLLSGENGPEHASVTVTFDDLGGRTRVTLNMVFSSRAELETARGFGAEELGQQTLAKLERSIHA